MLAPELTYESYVFESAIHLPVAQGLCLTLYSNRGVIVLMYMDLLYIDIVHCFCYLIAKIKTARVLVCAVTYMYIARLS